MSSDNQEPQLLSELCALLRAALPSPRPPGASGAVSPTGIASFLLGASLTMMLGGSMTFLIGFLLLPWVIGLVFMLYLVGLVSKLSKLGRAALSLFRIAAAFFHECVSFAFQASSRYLYKELPFVDDSEYRRTLLENQPEVPDL